MANPQKTSWWNLEWLAPDPKPYPGQPATNGTGSGSPGTTGGSVARTATQIAYNPAIAPGAAPMPASASRASHTHELAAAAVSSPLHQVQSAPIQLGAVPALQGRSGSNFDRLRGVT